MNLHLNIDKKFIGAFIERQEKFSTSKNKYVFFTKDKIIPDSSPELEIAPMQVNYLKQILKNSEGVKTIYFHGLSPFFQELIRKHNLGEKYSLVWIFYGGELFGSHIFYEKFLLPKTREIHRVMHPEIYLKFSVNPIVLRRNLINYRFYKSKLIESQNLLEEVIKKIDYFAHFIRRDYEKFVLPINNNIAFLKWSYAINSADTKNQKYTKTKTLILGNSASIYNNHADGLHYLRARIKESNSWDILTPLSYNDRRGYASKISKLGNTLFGERFKPLMGFLPLNKYEELISSVSAAVYFNVRSQAAGNVFWFIRQEVPVFLKKANTLYKTLEDIGIKSFSIEEDLPKFLEDSNYINPEALAKNSKNIARYFSDDNVRASYQELLSVS